MGRLRALLSLLALLLVSAVSPPAIPPAPEHHVTDTAGVMSASARDDLDARLTQYEQTSGRQVVAWIARTSGDMTIEELAVAAFAAWKVGKAGLDDGVALFVLVDDRKVRIEVGYGLEDRVTDLVASQIIRDIMVPRLREGDFDGAIAGGVEAIVAVIEGRHDALQTGAVSERGPPPTEPLGWGSWLAIGVFGLVFLVLLVTRPDLALLLLWTVVGRRGGGGTGGFSGGGGRSGGGGATGDW